MSLFLLDSNAISGLMRDPYGPIAARAAVEGEERVVTSIVVAAEIEFGLAKNGSERLRRRAEVLFSQMTIVPFDAPAHVEYGRLRTRLENEGRIIGALDLLIAAHALSLEAILITDNVREFGRVPGLAVENWLRR